MKIGKLEKFPKFMQHCCNHETASKCNEIRPIDVDKFFIKITENENASKVNWFGFMIIVYCQYQKRRQAENIQNVLNCDCETIKKKQIKCMFHVKKLPLWTKSEHVDEVKNEENSQLIWHGYVDYSYIRLKRHLGLISLAIKYRLIKKKGPMRIKCMNLIKIKIKILYFTLDVWLCCSSNMNIKLLWLNRSIIIKRWQLHNSRTFIDEQNLGAE